jgi:hypothetical protein
MSPSNPVVRLPFDHRFHLHLYHVPFQSSSTSTIWPSIPFAPPQGGSGASASPCTVEERRTTHLERTLQLIDHPTAADPVTKLLQYFGLQVWSQNRQGRELGGVGTIFSGQKGRLSSSQNNTKIISPVKSFFFNTRVNSTYKFTSPLVWDKCCTRTVLRGHTISSVYYAIILYVHSQVKRWFV